MDYNPDYILVSSLFLAFKVTQNDINLEKMRSLFSVDEKIIIEHEVLILTVVDYDLFIFCPYKAKMGLTYILEVKIIILKKKNSDFNKLIHNKNVKFDEINNLSNKVIDSSFKTNATFIFSFSQIALASLYITINALNIGVEDAVFFDFFGILDFESLKQSILEIDQEIKKLVEVNESEVKEALKIVKKFKQYNPEYYNELEKQKK